MIPQWDFEKSALRFDVIQLIVDSRESSFSIENASKTLKLLNFIRIVNRLLKDCTVKEDAIFERKPFLLVRKRAAINNEFKVFTKFHSINHYPISVFIRSFLSPLFRSITKYLSVCLSFLPHSREPILEPFNYIYSLNMGEILRSF